MANGIDTQSLITQLMAAERLPQDALKSKVTVMQKAQTLWTTIGTKLTGLATASDALAAFGTANTLIKATSSEANLGVRVSGAPVLGTIADVNVVSLATSQTTRANDTFMGSSDSVGARDLTLTINGVDHIFTSDDATIGGLVAKVNAAKVGVTASLVQVTPGSYQLVMRADKTGLAQAFTATGAGWTTAPAAFTNVRVAADAHIEVDGLSMYRASNVLTDVIDGLELTLKAPTTTPSNVTVGRDDDSLVTKIKAMVDATNYLINTVKNATATSTDAASRGPLSGDYTAAQISNKIRDAIAGGITGSDGVLRSSSVLGISLDRSGTVNFDETKLRDSLGTDASGVLASLSRGGYSSTTAVKISAITASANPGTRQIDVTQAATKAGLAGLFYPAGAPQSTANISVLTGGVAHAISFQIGNSNLETLTNLNASLQQDNIRILATSNGATIDLTASREGSTYDFSVSGDLTGSSSAGLNALATIDGVNVVGVGRSVTAGGVVFDVSAVTGGAKAVTFTDGLAGALSRLATQAGSSSGTITSASDALTSSLTEMNKRIDDWDTRLATLQTQYTHKFTAMDTMISQLNSQLTSLNSLLPSSNSG